uniref:RNase H type-1 domain-containing protein n=1 Tax=Fagus sylvatica TaxID=28930 RepID=A0A2N9GLD6_FAGSY
MGGRVHKQSGVGSHIGAVLQALSFGWDMGFLDVVVEGTYALFDDSSKRVHLEQTVLDAWVEDVQFLFKKFRRISVSTVSPRSNKAAMALAKVGSGLLRDRMWMEEIPVEIQAFL